MTEEIKIQNISIPHCCLDCKHYWGGVCYYWKITPLYPNKTADGLTFIICQKWENTHDPH